MNTNKNRDALSRKTPAYWYDQQVKFMAERGGTLSGYLVTYVPMGMAAQDVLGIYTADAAKLRSLAERLGSP